jgi:hypothetical protein
VNPSHPRERPTAGGPSAPGLDLPRGSQQRELVTIAQRCIRWQTSEKSPPSADVGDLRAPGTSTGFGRPGRDAVFAGARTIDATESQNDAITARGVAQLSSVRVNVVG